MSIIGLITMRLKIICKFYISSIGSFNYQNYNPFITLNIAKNILTSHVSQNINKS